MLIVSRRQQFTNLAVIKPARDFKGGDMSQDTDSYFVEGTKVIKFDRGGKGIWLAVLPAYTEDEEGNGMWYKVLRVRRNFGTPYKHTYPIADVKNDPAEHFAKKFKALYPALAEVTKNDEGYNEYPPYGYTPQRVLFNTVMIQKADEGVHVLDLPMYNGADAIYKYHKTADMEGELPDLICDPDGITPIHVSLNKGAGSPWTIQFKPESKKKLPDKWMDPDAGHLLNLDEIIEYKDPEWVIGILRDSFDPDVFLECMEGFAGFNETAVKPKKPSKVFDAPPSAPQVSGKANKKEVIDDLPELDAPAAKKTNVAKSLPNDLPDLTGEGGDDDDEIPFDMEENEVPERNPMSDVESKKQKAMEFLKD